MTKKQSILIVGLGLMGGSYAKALKKIGYQVYAIDTDLKTVDYALSQSIVDEASTRIESLIQKSKLILFAISPKATLSWIQKNQSLILPNTLLTDISGVKAQILDDIQSTLRVDLEFISTHPMAGKELKGIEHSDDQMFKKANFIVTPTVKNTQKAIDLAKEFGQSLGFKKVIELSPQKHDEVIAFVSQLTHVIAVSLMNTMDDPDIKNSSGDSFRDLTRIAKINEELWSELFILNKDNLTDKMEAFIETLTQFKTHLKNEDTEALKTLMKTSTQRRKDFDA
jgi:prephenate dehydrogenase